MSLTDGIAWYAAMVATIVAIKDLVLLWHERLHVTVSRVEKPVDGYRFRAVNTGVRPITVEAVFLRLRNGRERSLEDVGGAKGVVEGDLVRISYPKTVTTSQGVDHFVPLSALEDASKCQVWSVGFRDTTGREHRKRFRSG